MTLHHRYLDAADWFDRHTRPLTRFARWWHRLISRHGLGVMVAIKLLALVIGLRFVGPVSNEERCQFVATSPRVAAQVTDPIVEPPPVPVGSVATCEGGEP